jgi:two-component system chemotaxis response regulator CheY
VGYHILVVEDSVAMRSFIASTVEEIDGVSVTQAESGFAALKELPHGSFDMIITDINMPDINGLELIKFIRENEQYKTTPLVIVSTESSRRDRERGLSLGADGYLTKPFSPSVLIQTVKRFLGVE